MNLIEKIAMAFGKKKRDELLSFADLARAVADDKSTDPEKSVAMLRAAGKTPEDLAAAVARIKDRREARVIIERAKPVPARRAEVAKKAQAAADALETAKRVYEAAMAPLVEEERELDRLQDAARRAERKLQETVDEAYNEALHDASKERQDAANELGKLEKELHAATKVRDELAPIVEKQDALEPRGLNNAYRNTDFTMRPADLEAKRKQLNTAIGSVAELTAARPGLQLALEAAEAKVNKAQALLEVVV